MDEPCSIPPVTQLSDSSDNEWLPRVDAKKKASKRKASHAASLARKRPKVDDVVQIQILLSRKSSRCKSGCCDHFRDKGPSQELLAFRKEWAQLHKLDQDNVAA